MLRQGKWQREFWGVWGVHGTGTAFIKAARHFPCPGQHNCPTWLLQTPKERALQAHMGPEPTSNRYEPGSREIRSAHQREGDWAEDPDRRSLLFHAPQILTGLWPGATCGEPGCDMHTQAAAGSGPLSRSRGLKHHASRLWAAMTIMRQILSCKQPSACIAGTAHLSGSGSRNPFSSSHGLPGAALALESSRGQTRRVSALKKKCNRDCHGEGAAGCGEPRGERSIPPLGRRTRPRAAPGSPEPGYGTVMRVPPLPTGLRPAAPSSPSPRAGATPPPPLRLGPRRCPPGRERRPSVWPRTGSCRPALSAASPRPGRHDSPAPRRPGSASLAAGSEERPGRPAPPRSAPGRG